MTRQRAAYDFDFAATERQTEVLGFIGHFTAENGIPPSQREIGRAFDIRSTNGVNDHLRALERKGYITRTDLQSRAIVLTEKGKLLVFGPPCACCGGTGRRRARAVPASAGARPGVAGRDRTVSDRERSRSRDA